MDRMQNAALLLRLIERLREQGSWCGETHVQKATFFLKNLTQVPMPYDFILYKHGPFSFELRDELTALRADGLIDLEPQWPYGPRIVPTDRSAYIQEICSQTLRKYNACIAFVADKLGGKGVADLERLATALYVTKLTGADRSVEERAEELRRHKPHITMEGAKSAIVEVDKMMKEAETHMRLGEDEP
jgi:uncharacterized protein YwgA